MKKVLIVVDVSNLYYCCKHRLNGRLNYERLPDAVVKSDESLFRAIAYGAYRENETDQFQSALRHLNYEVKYKPVKDFGAGASKADWDVGIAMDVVKILDHVDVVVFCTADGDLLPCMEYVQFKGKEVRVCGCGISRDIRDKIANTIEITAAMLGD